MVVFYFKKKWQECLGCMICFFRILYRKQEAMKPVP